MILPACLVSTQYTGWISDADRNEIVRHIAVAKSAALRSRTNDEAHETLGGSGRQLSRQFTHKKLGD